MRGGVILLIVGLLIGYLAVSGKSCCIGQLFDCAASDSPEPCKCKATDTAQASISSPVNFASLLNSPVLSGALTYPYTV